MIQHCDTDIQFNVMSDVKLIQAVRTIFCKIAVPRFIRLSVTDVGKISSHSPKQLCQVMFLLFLLFLRQLD